MFPFIHIAVPLLVFELPKIKEKYQVNRYALIIGALLPDLVDKPLSILGIASGRGYGHTLLFALLAFLLVHLIFRKYKSISVSFLSGVLFHLILDIPYVPLLYPFIVPEIPESEGDPIGTWIEIIFGNPVTLGSEIIGVLILVFILINNDLYHISDILNYLKTANKSLKQNNNKTITDSIN